MIYMALNVFYSMVREAAEQIVRREPKLAFSANARICAILAKNYDIISGVSSIYMINQTAGIIPAEYMAVVAMNNADMTRALQMITLSLADFSVVIPNPSELMIVQSMDPANTKCNVYISPSEYVPITSLIEAGDNDEAEEEPVYSAKDMDSDYSAPANNSGYSVPDITESPFESSASVSNSEKNTPASNNAEPASAMSGFFSGFGDDDAESADVPDSSELEKMGFITNTAPDEYVSDFSAKQSAPQEEQYSTGVNIDENNPFLGNPQSSKGNNDVVYFADISDANNAQGNSNGSAPAQQAGRTAPPETMSKAELMKQAKQRKKVARANFNIRKK